MAFPALTRAVFIAACWAAARADASGPATSIPSLRGAGGEQPGSAEASAPQDEEQVPRGERSEDAAAEATSSLDALRDMKSGDSLVVCHGARVCRGAWTWVGGVRTCRGGFYCSSWALVLGSGNVEPTEVVTPKDDRTGAPPESQGEVAEPDDLEAMDSLEREAQSLAEGGEAESAESLCICRGVRVCRSWVWYGGARVCRGGFYCRL